jgi:hypothetical protein
MCLAMVTKRFVWWGMARSPGLAGLVALVSGAACSGNPPPCFGVAVGDKIAVTVLNAAVDPGEGIYSYDSGASDVCGFGFDLFQGLVLQATIVQSTDGFPGNCGVGIPQYGAFSGWTWTLSGATETGAAPNILIGEYLATNGTCNGSVYVSLQVTDGANPFSPSVPGQVPNVVMGREWFGGGPGCPTECRGDFVVNLQKQ